ncbi:hypothetical protein QQS21_011788 [Conoideocrella luteorostrata]|uniref:Asparaginase n=1 Tax=Conoideocrella luteorostrata TaxID=1105319 RepID=A0AAJ0CES3_9HYPO|nr:hypothetical protein QQS21_011788 [Conoideocrella luteorostrata]
MTEQAISTKSARPWHFILHGGCSETCPDTKRQHDVRQELQAVAKVVADTLDQGSTAKDAVVLAVADLEDCPLFNAGCGAALNHDRGHQLEAGIVEGTSTHYGAVGCVETTKNPIHVANALLEHGPHTMLVGRAADEMAKNQRRGDQIFKHLVAGKVANYHASGGSISDAARRALQDVSAHGAPCALAVIDTEGNCAVESTARLFSVAKGSSSVAPTTCLYPTTFSVLSPHEFYNDSELLIDHSRYPTTPGHSLAILKSTMNLFSLQPAEIVRILSKTLKSSIFPSRVL